MYRTPTGLTASSQQKEMSNALGPDAAETWRSGQPGAEIRYRGEQQQGTQTVSVRFWGNTGRRDGRPLAPKGLVPAWGRGTSSTGV